jgi:hypothetical protein
VSVVRDYHTARVWPSLLPTCAVAVAASILTTYILITGGAWTPTIRRPAVAAASPAVTATRHPYAADGQLRAVDIMAELECDGEVIGTQLYTRETGRCMLADVSVVIAVFDSAAMRDRWLAVTGRFDGYLVAGDVWAVETGDRVTADAIAARLDGRRV